MGFFTLQVYTPPHLLRIRIKIRIRQIHILLGLLDPDPDQLVRGLDPGFCSTLLFARNVVDIVYIFPSLYSIKQFKKTFLCAIYLL
jgi:hypothetical protein